MSDDDYETKIEAIRARSKFTGLVSIGEDYEWQELVDTLQARIDKDASAGCKCQSIIIFTGLVQHNINVTMTELHEEFHEEGDDLMKSMQKLSVIACTPENLEQAILDFQGLGIVKGTPETRSCAGPNLKDITNYYISHKYQPPLIVGKCGELQVTLSWDS